MKKKISEAFRKQIVFLGQKKDGTNVWLEFPSFDCKWYWGFGYLESYTNNNNPSMSKDITCHEHFDGLVIYSSENIDFVINGKELIELVDLFKKFYEMKKIAAQYHQNDIEKWKMFNVVYIPKVMTKILSLLCPNPSEIKFEIPNL